MDVGTGLTRAEGIGVREGGDGARACPGRASGDGDGPAAAGIKGRCRGGDWGIGLGEGAVGNWLATRGTDAGRGVGVRGGRGGRAGEGPDCMLGATESGLGGRGGVKA